MAKRKNKNAAAPTEGNKKTATNNQWVSTGLPQHPDHRERRDGPGGENGE